MAKFSNMLNPDVMLQKLMGAFIYLTEKKAQMEVNEWKPGEPLKILFAGYAGARNTGGDVRVEEMIRQVRHILAMRTLICRSLLSTKILLKTTLKK